MSDRPSQPPPCQPPSAPLAGLDRAACHPKRAGTGPVSPRRPRCPCSRLSTEKPSRVTVDRRVADRCHRMRVEHASVSCDDDCYQREHGEQYRVDRPRVSPAATLQPGLIRALGGPTAVGPVLVVASPDGRARRRPAGQPGRVGADVYRTAVPAANRAAELSAAGQRQTGVSAAAATGP